MYDLCKVKTFYIVVLLVNLLTISHAKALTCDRYSIDANGFSSLSTASSWYPERVFLDDYEFKPKAGSKQMVYRRETVVADGGISVVQLFYLLPNGKMISSVQGRSGYQHPGQAKYKCDITSVELQSELKGTISNVRSSDSDVQNKEKSIEKKAGDIDFSLAKQKCAEIGFNKGTEKYADCVMKLID